MASLAELVKAPASCGKSALSSKYIQAGCLTLLCNFSFNNIRLFRLTTGSALSLPLTGAFFALFWCFSIFRLKNALF